MAILFAVVGSVLLAVTSLFGAIDGDAVVAGFASTKVNAFVGALPTAVLTYAVLRQCEAGKAAAGGVSRGMV